MSKMNTIHKQKMILLHKNNVKYQNDSSYNMNKCLIDDALIQLTKTQKFEIKKSTFNTQYKLIECINYEQCQLKLQQSLNNDIYILTLKMNDVDICKIYTFTYSNVMIYLQSKNNIIDFITTYIQMYHDNKQHTIIKKYA